MLDKKHLMTLVGGIKKGKFDLTGQEVLDFAAAIAELVEEIKKPDPKTDVPPMESEE